MVVKNCADADKVLYTYVGIEEMPEVFLHHVEDHTLHRLKIQDHNPSSNYIRSCGARQFFYFAAGGLVTASMQWHYGSVAKIIGDFYIWRWYITFLFN